MTELAAQRSRINKIVAAAQSIQERIVCGICLELFNEPVTLTCGHRFCRSCIFRVTKNENSACPFCNKKIRKRSIPTEGNKGFQLIVNQFLTLIQAIKEDSGIDVLEPCIKTKNTKESVALNNKPSTSNLEQNSNISKGSSTLSNQKSTNSRIKSQSRKRNSVTKKQVNKTPGGTKNTLDKYLANSSSNVPDRELHSEEKVKSWLNNISSHTDDTITSDSNNEDGSPFLKKDNEKFKVPEILESPRFVKSTESCEINNRPSTSKAKEPELDETINVNDEELKYKETQSRVQELEMVARRKKLNLNLADKTALKTTSSVPAATHSDAYDWRRVKKIGKEMQANTFKSLNVSVEKNSLPVAVDDNIPSTSSAINDNKNRQKVLKVQDNSLQKENAKINNSSMNTTDSHRGENVSLPGIEEDMVNEIIGISYNLGDLRIPKRTRKTSNVLNEKCTSKLEQLNPLIGSAIKNHENDPNDNLQNSPIKHKLSLKKNITNSGNSKLASSQSGSSDKTNQSENNSPRKFSPERPKSRLSLRLPSTKTSDQNEKQSKSDILNHNDIQSTITEHNFQKQNLDINKNSVLSRGSRILFKKLGKICKKRKNVPFLKLGKIRLKIIKNTDNEKQSNVLVKSNIPVHFEINSLVVSGKPSTATSDVPDNKEMKILLPEEDSQLKYLAIESPHRKKHIDRTENVNKSILKTCHEDKSHSLMEIDAVPPTDPELQVLMEVNEVSSVHVKNHKLDLQKSNNAINKINDTIDCEEISKDSNEKNVEDNLKIVSSSSSSSESSEDDKESDYSERNQNSSSIKATAAENEDEQNILSIGLKESNTFSRNPSVQKIVENNRVDIEDKKSIHSEVQSNASSKIQNKLVKKSATTSSIVSSANKHSEVESSSDGDVSDDEKIQSKSSKTSSASTVSSVSERNEVSEAKSKVHTGNSKIRQIRKPNCSNSRLTNEKHDILKVDTNTDLYNSKMRSKSKKSNSSSRSTLSSIKTTSKKKRSRSVSSNDEDEDLDVTSIIGKWCGNDVQVSKKPKIISSSHEDLITNQDKTKLIPMEDDDLDATLVGDENQMKTKTLQRDSPIDDIIPKVKNLEEIESCQSKLVTIPSSLMSADLFESNEPCVQPSTQVSPKQLNSEVIADKSQDEIDTTLVEVIQTSRKKSFRSESSDASNKENHMFNKMNPPVREEDNENRINEIENSHNEKSRITKNFNNETDAYQISESLMNITQEQIALKRIEKDLIGIDLSAIHENKNMVVQDRDKNSTPQGKKKETRNIDEGEMANEDDDFYPDNIDGTPHAKKSKKSIADALPSQILSRFNAGSEINSSEICSPGYDVTDLIPAITPMKNRKSYPLCHSTPVINTSNSESQLVQRQLVLVCSGLQPEQNKKVQAFVKRFNAKFQPSFTMDVTHVITSTDPETKVGQRTFKYIQGIAFQKHVLSFQWILDCLNKNTLVDEEDEKYEVLDGDVLESGAKKSRNRQKDLFENFAFFCLEPFTALLISEFKNILSFNGAVVVDSVEELAAQQNKYRIIILPDDYNLSPKKLNFYKKVHCALVSFDWIVDSISQYHTISIAPYLQETTPEELLALGFPAEYLIEEEYGEEDEEDELE